MTDQEKLDAHEQALEQLRNYVSSLRKEQRLLGERRQDLDAREGQLEADLVEAEAALKGLAMTRAPQLPQREEKPAPRKRRPSFPPEVVRDAMQQLDEFSIPELATVLETNEVTARRLVLKALEEPFGQDAKPLLEDTGTTKYTGGPRARVFRFVRPEPNGNAPHSRPRGAPEIELCRRGATPAPTGRKLKVRKDTRELVALAKASGFGVERTRNGHLRLTKDGERAQHLASTGSDHRGVKNAAARIKRVA